MLIVLLAFMFGVLMSMNDNKEYTDEEIEEMNQNKNKMIHICILSLLLIILAMNMDSAKGQSGGGFNMKTKIVLGLVAAAAFFLIFFHIFSAGGDSFFESLKDSFLAVAISALFIALIIFGYFLMTKLKKKGTDGQEIKPDKP